MKLSEALREGIKKRPRQCFGYWFEGEDASCALAAVGDSLIYADRNSYIDRLEKLYGHPLGGHTYMLKWIIINLNDTHHWTRVAIADWLEKEGL